MKTYIPAHMRPINPLSAAWALAWARHFAGDYPLSLDTEPDVYPLDSWDDAVWLAMLDATAYVVWDEQGAVVATYYRPHEAAAIALDANPHWLQRESVLGATQERRPLSEIVQGIRWAGRIFDEEIGRLERLAGRSVGLTAFEVVF